VGPHFFALPDAKSAFGTLQQLAKWKPLPHNNVKTEELFLANLLVFQFLLKNGQSEFAKLIFADKVRATSFVQV